MQRIIKLFGIIVFTILVLSIAFGQTPENRYTIQNFTDEDGLPQNSVKSITADDMGFVWLGTEEGVARFDGERIVNLQNVKDAVGNGRFRQTIPDMFGRSDRFYSVKFDERSIRMRHATISYDSSLDYNRLAERMALSKDRHSIIGGSEPGHGKDDFAQDIHNIFLAVVGRKGTYYKITRQTISFFVNWEQQWKQKNRFGVLNRFFLVEGILHHLDDSGNIVRLEKGRWSGVKLKGDIAADANADQQPSLFWNLINNQIFLLVEDRFYQLQTGKGNSWNTRLVLNGFAFEANHIQSVYYDPRSGRLLLGSITRGLFLAKRHDFTTVRSSKDDAENVIYGQIGLDSNRILLPNGRIETIMKKATGIRVASSQTEQHFRISSESTRVMLKDREGRIWASTRNELRCYSPNGERLLRTELFNADAIFLFEMPDGDILAEIRKEGFYRISTKDTRKPSYYKLYPDSANVNFVGTIDSQNILLASSKGIFKYNINTRKLHLVDNKNKFDIKAMRPGRDGPDTYFFATSSGLAYFNGKKMIPLPLDNRGYLKSGHCLVEDANGYFWITTNKGLFQICIDDLYHYVDVVDQGGAPPKLFYLYYDKYEGFATNEFNGYCQPCALRLDNGFVSLPSINGLVLFEPERIQLNIPNRPLIIDRVEEKGDVRIISEDTVQLEPNPGTVGFFFSTSYFGSSENLHFSYAMMRGQEVPKEADWISISEPFIRFSDLGSGYHKLWVRKASGFGLNNYSTASVGVLVPLAWYETIWFMVFATVLLVGLVFLTFRIRTQNLRRRNQQLENKVTERTRNLQEALISLQSSEKELSRQMQLQSRLIASISHDVRTPISYFASAADMAGDMMEAKQKSEARKLLFDLGTSARQIFGLVDNLVNFSKSQIYGLHTKTRPIQLRPLIEEKLLLFRAVLLQRNISFDNKLPAKLEVVSSQQLLGIMVHNLLDNAMKHSQRSSTARAWAESRDDGLHLIFSDTGNGLPKDIIEWLNTALDKESSQDALPQDYRGLGLLIVKETAAILKIKVFAENQNGAHIHLIFG